MLENIHFHDHKDLEILYKIPQDHVIIDRESYNEIVKLRDNDIAIQKIKEKEEKRYQFDEPILRLYPNKFKFIKDVAEAKEPGLYYINPKVPDCAIESLIKWIAWTLEQRFAYPCGYNRCSIENAKFSTNFGYHFPNDLNYKMDIPLGERECYYNQRINPVRIDQAQGSPRIIIWGDSVRGIRINNLPYMTVCFAGVLMSVFDMLFTEGEQRALDYCTVLKRNRYVYRADQHPVYRNIVCLTPTKTHENYVMDFDKPDDIRKDFEILKKYLLK